MTKGEKNWWFGMIVTMILAIFIWFNNILEYCIFEWPPRWNKACFQEQWEPAVEKAVKGPPYN